MTTTRERARGPAAARYVLRTLAAILLIGTLFSLIESNEWWIRIWDFPRAQILAGLLIVGALALWLERGPWRWLAVVCVLAATWQFVRIYPYTRFATPEIALAGDNETRGAACFSVLSLNVLQDNRDYRRTAALIDRMRPDILLLMETDRAWVDALAPQLGRYPSILSAPLDNTYGLVLATRLPMTAGRIETIAEERTPSATATLVAGVPFRLIALHPRPPVPGQDTEERDVEIAIAARRAAATPGPVMAIGDFNDVAWSNTSRLFKRIGGYLDPRIGRGTYATFPAAVPLLGWPLDHLFVTPEFLVRSLAVLEHVGSDHRPIHAELCLAGTGAANPPPEPATAEDIEDTREVVDEYVDDQREEAR